MKRFVIIVLAILQTGGGTDAQLEAQVLLHVDELHLPAGAAEDTWLRGRFRTSKLVGLIHRLLESAYLLKGKRTPNL